MKVGKREIFILGLFVLSLVLFYSPVFAEEIRQATISQLQGDVEVRMAGSGWKPAEVGMVLHQKDEVRTGDESYAEFMLDNAGETGKFDLEENSQLTFSQMMLDSTTGDKTTLLDLAIGRVLIQAAKLQGNSKFEVKTPTSTAGVRGTVFEVVVEKEEK